MFSSDGRKDSVTYIEETGEFVCNLAVYDLLGAVVATGVRFARGVNEMKEAGLEAAPSRHVAPPRVKGSPAALECKLLQIIGLNDLDGRSTERLIVLGQVVGVHIDDRFICDGRLDTAAMQPIARCGYGDYSVVDRVIPVKSPKAASAA
jgi:flavin reductase (DIM6/NTAB) family NADH-FMN oxidoreductase RutF